MLLLVFTFRCLTTGNIQRKMTLWQLTTGSFSQNEQHQQQIYSMNFLHFTFGIWQLAIFITMNITKPFRQLTSGHWQLTSGHWQLTSGNNEHHQIKTLKSGPKIEKTCVSKKQKQAFKLPNTNENTKCFGAGLVAKMFQVWRKFHFVQR